MRPEARADGPLPRCSAAPREDACNQAGRSAWKDTGRGGLFRVEHDVPAAGSTPVRAPPHRVAGVPPVGGQHPGEHLEGGRPRQLARDPDETRMLPGPEITLCAEEGAKLRGGQRRSVPEHDAGHDLVAGHWVWHAVHGRLRDGGMPAQGPLDGCGTEVFPVHPQPLTGPSGEPAEPAGVRIPQVTTPVHAITHPARIRLRVVVVRRQTFRRRACSRTRRRLRRD